MFDHLRETGLSYRSHMRQALRYSWCFQVCAIKVFAHALAPNLFVNDASDEICRLHKEMNGE